jgi:hypothetical protein
MKSCIISCILPLCTTHLFLVIVVLFLNQTFPACLITERRFYNFQSWPKFKSGGFAKVFKQKSKQIRKREKEKRFYKGRNAAGITSAQVQKTAHGPLTLFSESVPSSPPLAADNRDPPVIPSEEFGMNTTR